MVENITMIETVTKDNIDEVIPLIRQYLEFYKVKDISDSQNKEFFSQFGEHNPFGCQFIYKSEGKVVGFATVYFTFTSSITAKVGILNDLYTTPKMRGKGIGRKLIEHCRKYSASRGVKRLQWVTAPDNEKAQKLYKSLDVNESFWKFYTYNVG